MNEGLQKEKESPIVKFENTLRNGYGNSLRNLLRENGMSEDKFIVTLVTAFKKTPKLLECDQKSIFGAILTAAELGLQPNTPMGFSYLIPYKNECQFQIGYQGWIELMHRNEAVKKIYSDVVYEKDTFVDERGMNRVLKHTPCVDQANKGKKIAVYAIVWLKDSEDPVDVVLYESDILKFKKISQSGNKDYGPWNDSDKDPMAWMWKKTAIKQVSKMIPKSNSKLSIAVHRDNVVETGGQIFATEDGEVEVIESQPEDDDEKVKADFEAKLNGVKKTQ